MENKGKISNITGILMVSTALCFDGVQALFTCIIIGPAINWLIGIFAWLTFWLWFNLNGVKFVKSPKNFFTLNIAGLCEIIPFVATLPAWTTSVIILVMMNKIEVATTKVTKKPNLVKSLNFAENTNG